jgi:hypothetical protein
MATITITVPDDAGVLAEKHAQELGYHSAADLAFELLRNKVAEREDSLYHRMAIGELNPVFGRSAREQADVDRLAAAEAAAAAQAAADAEALSGAAVKA